MRSEDYVYGNPEDENDYEVDDQSTQSEYPQPWQGGSSLMDKVSLVQGQVNTALGLAQDISGLYSECIRLNEHRREVEAMTQEKLVRTIAKYKTAEKFITSSFAERNGALQNYYSVLDDAVRKGDKELIIAAMSNISGIVTTSPLKDLEKLCQSFDESLDNMLDFD